MDSLTSILKQKSGKTQRFAFPKDKIPASISCEKGHPGKILFSDGTTHMSKCVGCPTKPCMYYAPDEIKSKGAFKDFPADSDERVCASNAISWNEQGSHPSIDPSQCILCGACVTRCPAKALFFDSENNVKCNSSKSSDSFFQLTEKKDEADRTLQLLRATPVKGQMLDCSATNLDTAYSRIFEVSKTMGPQFPNLLSRNLLNSLGFKATIRRRGDVYLRTDLVFENGGKQGLCEIEFFPQVMLDAPRDVLDDMAVFISRYSLKKEVIQPLIIGLELPNQRSEYWQVIEDIKTVLGAQIATMTIGGLLLLIWEFKRIDLSKQELPYGSDKTFSIKDGIAKLLGRNFEYGNSKFSLFESRK